MLDFLLIAALAFAAPGDIYRCADASGNATFQDKPCTGARTKNKFDGSANDTRDLRQWLERMRGKSAVAAPPAHSAAPPPEPHVASGDERRLAACSERFLACADGDETRMDACIARVARCAGASSASCCPSACITRYQALRQQGNPLSASVKGALLDPDQPSCAAQ